MAIERNVRQVLPGVSVIDANRLHRAITFSARFAMAAECSINP
jgi:hypothetical protein